jgi:hypothetical protein
MASLREVVHDYVLVPFNAFHYGVFVAMDTVLTAIFGPVGSIAAEFVSSFIVVLVVSAPFIFMSYRLLFGEAEPVAGVDAASSQLHLSAADKERARKERAADLQGRIVPESDPNAPPQRRRRCPPRCLQRLYTRRLRLRVKVEGEEVHRYIFIRGRTAGELRFALHEKFDRRLPEWMILRIVSISDQSIIENDADVAQLKYDCPIAVQWARKAREGEGVQYASPDTASGADSKESKKRA